MGFIGSLVVYLQANAWCGEHITVVNSLNCSFYNHMAAWSKGNYSGVIMMDFNFMEIATVMISPSNTVLEKTSRLDCHRIEVCSGGNRRTPRCLGFLG